MTESMRYTLDCMMEQQVLNASKQRSYSPSHAYHLAYKKTIEGLFHHMNSTKPERGDIRTIPSTSKMTDDCPPLFASYSEIPETVQEQLKRAQAYCDYQYSLLLPAEDYHSFSPATWGTNEGTRAALQFIASTLKLEVSYA